MQDLMTVPEAAAFHRCSEASIKLAIVNGKITGRQTSKGGRWWLLGSSVRDWEPDRSRQIGRLRSITSTKPDPDPVPIAAAHPAAAATAARLDALTEEIAGLRADLRPVLDALT